MKFNYYIKLYYKMGLILDKILKYKYWIIITFVLMIAIVLLFNWSKLNVEAFESNIKWNQHYYINLDHRTDRNDKTISELKKIGITDPNRFSAIKDEHHGGIGCGLSHINVLKNAKRNNWDYVIIMEDDIIFHDPKETVQKINNIFNSDVEWDVLIVGSIIVEPIENVNNDCAYAKGGIQATPMYIVKSHYYDTLIDLWTKAMNDFKNVFLKHGDKKMDQKYKDNIYGKYAIDQQWKTLQKQDKFLTVIPNKVNQIGSPSDIQNSHYN